MPRYTGGLVGRDPLVAEVVDRLEGERLVTLLGTGGIGQTRVAAEVARASGSGSGGDVWFCAGGRGTSSVVTTVATTTGVDLRAGVGLLSGSSTC